MAAAFDPAPYQEGKALELDVSESHPSGDLPPRVTATINKVLSMTMSVVLVVTLQTRTYDPPIRCVLKLYDRRFGSGLRDILKNKTAPYTRETEATFEAFVRRGMMPEFLRYVKERDETEDFPVRAWPFLDEESEEYDPTDGAAKYEAMLWRQCIEHFVCETKAYHRLADCQGRLVPRLLAHVSLSTATQLAAMPPELAPYFEVKGILLEYIDGFCLDDLTRTTPLPRNLRTWQQLIQSAADMAHEINDRYGIVMEDCAPRNVVVDQQSYTPRIIDLAQCRFRDELVEKWYEWEWHEDEGWDPDVEYWEQAYSTHNPGAIGAVMVTLVERKTGIKLPVRYPDYEAIFAGIRQRKAEAAVADQEKGVAKGMAREEEQIN